MENETGLKMEKKGQFLTITRPDKKQVRYDLKEQKMFKEENGKWVQVMHQYIFFYGFRMSHLTFPDKKFEKLVRLAQDVNPNCESVSSFITRISDVLVYENYINEGIEFEASYTTDYGGSINQQLLSKPMGFYSKPIITFFKTYNIEVTRDIEEKFTRDYKFYENLISVLMKSEIPPEKKGDVFQTLTDEYGASRAFFELVREHNYNPTALLNYLFGYIEPFEALEWEDAVGTLKDYYRMAKEIGRNVKKYPKYLNSMHDIITANYNSFKKEYDEKKFAKTMRPKLEFKDKKYCVVIPKNAKDIISEGTDLNHCIGSYVDKILLEECYIMFLRLKKEPKKSLVTIEVIKDAITQAKGSYNRQLEKEEKEFLNLYAKKKKLGVKI